MNTQTRKTLALGSILAFSLLTAGCSTGESSGDNADFSASETVSQTFPYSAQKLTIDSGTAELILVAGNDDGEVRVDRQIAGTANGESPETQEVLDGDTLNLSVNCNGIAFSCQGRFTVTVPSGVAVVAQNKSSKITADNFGADLTVSAVNGRAELTQISSSNLKLTGKDMAVDAQALSSKTISTDTRNGDIDLTFSEAPDRIDVNSQDGDVHLALPDTEYRVGVTTKKGKENVGVSRSDSSDHRITVTTRNGDAAIVSAH